MGGSQTPTSRLSNMLVRRMQFHRKSIIFRPPNRTLQACSFLDRWSRETKTLSSRLNRCELLWLLLFCSRDWHNVTEIDNTVRHNSVCFVVVVFFAFFCSCHGVPWRMALSFIQEDLEIPTAHFNLEHLRMPRVSCLRFCYHPRLYFLPCLPQIFRKTPWQNDNLCLTSSITIFWHKPRRANIEQIFQRHRLHWRGSAQNLPLGHPDDSVRVYSSTIALVYQLLAVSRFPARIHYLSLCGVLLLEDLAGIEEIRVHLS